MSSSAYIPNNSFENKKEFSAVKSEEKMSMDNSNEGLSEALKAKPLLTEYLNKLSNEELRAICEHRAAAEEFYYSNTNTDPSGSEPVIEFEMKLVKWVDSVSFKAERNLQEHSLLVETANEGIKLVEAYFKVFREFSKLQNVNKGIAELCSLENIKRVVDRIGRQLAADIEGVKKKFKKDRDTASFIKDFVEKQTLFHKFNHYSEKLRKNLFDYEDSI